MSILLKLAAEVEEKETKQPEKSSEKKTESKPFPPKKDEKKPEDGEGDKVEEEGEGEGEGGEPVEESAPPEDQQNTQDQQAPQEQQAQGPSADMIPMIIDFLDQNPNPPDSAIHALAEQNGLDVDAVEAAVYTLATSLVQLLRGGKSAGADPNQFDPDQIAKGMEVESEHTDFEPLRKKIAMDHLIENPKYYDYLQAMEDQMKQGAQDESQQKVAKLLARSMRLI